MNSRLLDTTSLDDLAKVKWAWSVSSEARRDAGPRISSKAAAAISSSPMRDDLMDVVRMLNTNSAGCQTSEPSYTASLRTVSMDDNDHRSVGLQCGLAGRQSSAAVQVSESDVADGSIDVDTLQSTMLRDNEFASSAKESRNTLHTRHAPHCGLTPDDYPLFLHDAKVLGVANRFGFLSMPKLEVGSLPPRRNQKLVEPVDYPHLYGSHNEQIDEALLNRIDRTHALWAANSGFVPRF